MLTNEKAQFQGEIFMINAYFLEHSVPKNIQYGWTPYSMVKAWGEYFSYFLEHTYFLEHNSVRSDSAYFLEHGVPKNMQYRWTPYSMVKAWGEYFSYFLEHAYFLEHN